jgi:hypothetical protein
MLPPGTRAASAANATFSKAAGGARLMHANATDPSAWQGQFVGEAIGLLTGVLVACTLGLVPGQSRAVLGVEVLAAGLLAWSVQIGIHLQAVRGCVGPSPAVRIGRIGLAQAAVLPLPVAGVSLLLGAGGGLSWLVPGIVLCLVVAVLDAWVLLIEILR